MSRINFIGVSGGKDSTALLLWAVNESGYDRATIRAGYNDHGNDLPETISYIRMLSERVHPIEFIKPALDFYQLAYKKKRFPSRRARFCTEQLKLVPTRDYIRALMLDGYEVVVHSGVRAGESAERAELPERDEDSFFDCEIYRPLLHWAIEDVWAIHERYSIPRNPLYALGCKRVGCFPCVMSRKSEIRIMAEKFPERIALISAAENRFIEIHGEPRTFFHRTVTTKPYRTLEVQTKQGAMMVPTIDDVVEWSKSYKGAKAQMDRLFDDELSDDIGVCPSQYG